MVEIWKQNLRESLKDFKERIAQRPLFVAIDCEFTGLHTVNDVKTRYFDLPQTRYTRARESAMTYSLVQLGMAVFLTPEGGEAIQVHTYTLNLFPSTMFKNSFDFNFRCQTRSLEFLAQNGFDFNRLFTDAVPYFNMEDEKDFRQRQSNHKQIKTSKKEDRAKSTQRVKVVRPYDKEFVIGLKRKLNMFRERLKIDQELIMDVECRNRFQRMLVYDIIDHEYPDIKYKKERNIAVKERPFIRCSKLLMDREKARELDEQANDLEIDDKLSEQKGLNHFVDTLTESDIPIITHNGLLDLLHIYTTTRKSPDKNFEAFAEDLMQIFPLFFDTKVVATAEGVREEVESTALSALKEQTESWPGPVIEERGETKAEERNEHHAGFDALLTGKIMLKFLTKLGIPMTQQWTKFAVINELKNCCALVMNPSQFRFDKEKIRLWRHDFKNVIVFCCKDYIAQSDIEYSFKQFLAQDEHARCYYRPSDRKEGQQEALISLPLHYPTNEVLAMGHKVACQFARVLDAYLQLDYLDAKAPFYTSEDKQSMSTITTDQHSDVSSDQVSEGCPNPNERSEPEPLNPNHRT